VLGVLLVLALAVGQMAVLAPTPLSGGPRPSLAGAPPPDRWVPPHPHVSERFATFPARGPQGQPGLWVMPSARVPIGFAVEQEVIDRFGADELEAAIEVFNDVPGTRFGARIARIVDDGVDERSRDGVHRVFLDRRSCGDRYLARAHLWSQPVRVRGAQAVRYVTEVDIGLCDRLEPRWLETVIRHELAHIAGLDHLCDPGEDCHRPGMGSGHECRIMHTRLHPCQELTDGDLDGLVHLHPRLPRAGGGDERTASADVARVGHPAARTSRRAVVTPHDAPLVQRLVSASFAGHIGAPHVLVDEACTTGPDGAALDHVLTVTGTVIAVGDLPRACATTLSGSWGLELETLPDARAVIDHLVGEAEDRPASRLILAPRPDETREVPLAAAAAAGAVALRAPLVVPGPDGEMERILDVIEDHPSVREVIVVGDVREVGTRVLAALSAAGVAVRRLPARDASEATAQLLEQPELTGQGPFPTAVVAQGRPEHAVAGVSLASALDGLLLPVDQEPTRSQLDLLAESFDRGAIVGSPAAVHPDLQRRLSRALDGET
jgi:hypothetical protein